jgi:dienelactone hydrolase
MKRSAAWVMAALIASGAAAKAQDPPPAAMTLPPPEVSDPLPGGERIAGDHVFANFYPGKGEGRRPGVLLLAGSEGGLGGGTGRIAQALAGEGFAVLQLCYFGCPGLPPRLANVPLEIFTQGLAWLKRDPRVDGSRLAVMGGSKGSEPALLLAARAPELKAVVATQPSSVVWPGITFEPEPKPGWTENGSPLDFLPYAKDSETEKGIFFHYKNALAGLGAHPGAVIAVEKIRAPILLVCGEADTLWPSCPMADQIAARLKAKGRRMPTILRYANAGHEVFGLPIDRSSPHFAHLGSLGGTPDGIAAAHEDDWPKTVAFLKTAMR